jgi:hypothetical protein
LSSQIELMKKKKNEKWSQMSKTADDVVYYRMAADLTTLLETIV